MIRIDNLTALQVELCERMWNLENIEDVEEFIATLPARLRPVARSLREIMLMEYIDDVVGDDLSLAQGLIRDIQDRS